MAKKPMTLDDFLTALDAALNLVTVRQLMRKYRHQQQEAERQREAGPTILEVIDDLLDKVAASNDWRRP